MTQGLGAIHDHTDRNEDGYPGLLFEIADEQNKGRVRARSESL